MNKEQLSQLHLDQASNVLHESLKVGAKFPLSLEDVGEARYVIEKRRLSKFNQKKVGIFPTSKKLRPEDYGAALEVWNDLYDAGDITQSEFAKYSKPPTGAVRDIVKELTGEIWKSPDLEDT